MKMEAEVAAENLREPTVIGDYVLRSKLEERAYSTVWRAEHLATGETVALKQVHLSRLNRQLRNCLDCEISFLSSVKHPNIIRLLDVLQVEQLFIFFRPIFYRRFCAPSPLFVSKVEFMPVAMILCGAQVYIFMILLCP